MKKKIHYLLIFILLTSFSFGQNKLWSKVSEEKLNKLDKMERGVFPSKYHLYQLDLDNLKRLLMRAPMENPTLSSDLIIQFPTSKGDLVNFKVFEAPVMEKELSDKFPSIRSYAAQGMEDPSITLRFSITDFGLHVMSLSGEDGMYYIDTYTKDLNNYIVYNRSDVQKVRSFGCFVEDEDEPQLQNEVLEQRVNDGNLRQYRLAIACTVEYAAFHLNAAGTPVSSSLAVKKAVVLSAMVVSLTRLNGVYEREMAVRMNLVGNNDKVIFIDSDQFTNSPAMLNEIQDIVNAEIGVNNYDMGHGFCTTDSGVAQVSSVCSSGKARGITGQLNPVGDPFDIDYVAHEMGHQFGALHTQNNPCNRSDDSAFEPGSASTILGYAGICAPNVQTGSDAYFHARSIQQMTNFVTNSANCRTLFATSNVAPVVNAGLSYTIPNGTAFKLTGSATDSNGDALTYCWEQYNNEVSVQPPSASAVGGPNFRSRMPSSSPTRFFPQFQDVLAGSLTPTWEVIPNVARTMNFALTVRDNRLGGGMSNRGNMTVTTAAVGPFKVTSPLVGASLDMNSTQTITWDVAGTTGNGINTVNVNILLSTDDGATFTTLLANTPNDGSQAVTMPSVPAVKCRIIVEAVGNIFYAVSSNFSIGYVITTTCNTYTNNAVVAIPDGVGANAMGQVAVKTITIPAPGSVITDVNVTVGLNHSYPRDVVIALNHPDDSQVYLWNKNCQNTPKDFEYIFDDSADFAVPATGCTAVSGSWRPTGLLSGFNGKNSTGVWTLLFGDTKSGSTGSIRNWSIEICSQTIVLASESYGLEDFSLYPNPNNGNFNIQFNSNSGNEIKVNVHDMSGRAIFNRSYDNMGLFNETLQLSNAQAGVYIVTIQDGSRKEVKKIVVQ
ncbi:reprolysin-like metallopeptidase [Flavobacterium ardleyense]|uniref:Reprolysin-like metallopeptidase n=1 Tax=Flavobacterium ardleyense TaxID=2038737 RepID=A0ABW5Z6A2_9FLAO